jgi:hypothetical protein
MLRKQLAACADPFFQSDNSEYQFGNFSMNGFRENLKTVRSAGLSVSPAIGFWASAA